MLKGEVGSRWHPEAGLCQQRLPGVPGESTEGGGTHTPAGPRSHVLFLEIFPLPRLTEMSRSIRTESCTQLPVSLRHIGRSIPIGSQRL